VVAQVTNLEEFSRELKVFDNLVPELALRLQKKIAFDMLTKIVQRTPVGNPDLWKTKYPPKGYVGGRARANWQVDLLDPDESSQVEGEDKSGASTIATGASAIGRAQFGNVIWLYNNLPYIVRLEYGWSQQAPGGMVRLSVAEIEAAFAT
jgi:hypothetical protein